MEDFGTGDSEQTFWSLEKDKNNTDYFEVCLILPVILNCL
jgi:hypothetical protein